MRITTASCPRSGGPPQVALERRYVEDHGRSHNVQASDRLLQAARALNAAGWRAFPVKADGWPAVRGYRGSRPYSCREVDGMPWAKAAWLGIAEQPGVIALDVDHKDGARDGYAHLRALEQAYGPLPPTRQYTSPTGGVHLRFRLPVGIHETALSGCLVLPDGTKAHIDVLRHRHRFHRVWDVSQWLEPVDGVPELPQEWLPALLKQSKRRPEPASALDAWVDGAGDRGPGISIDEMIEAVATAPEHTRNESLNDMYFRACLHGHTSVQTRERFAQAAHQAGLAGDEVERTLDSAWQSAWRKWRPVETWLDTVQSRVQLAKGRAKWPLAAAEELARVHMELPEVWINMSSRRLGESLSVSRTVAAQALKQLVTWGLVQRRKSKGLGLAPAYKLNINTHSIDIYPLSSTKDGYMSTYVPYGVDHRDGRELRTVRSHPAFSRVGPGAVLTPTCPEVLLALRAGPLKRSDLARRLLRSPAAVSRAVRVLESAGLVDDRGRQGVSLTGSLSAREALDEWAADMGLGDRDQWRRDRHDQERLAFYRQYRLLPPEPKPDSVTEPQGMS